MVERLASAAVWRASALASEWAAEGEREQHRAQQQALAVVSADEQALTLSRAQPVSVGSGVVSVASVSSLAVAPRASVVVAVAALPAVPLAAAVVNDGLDSLDLDSKDPYDAFLGVLHLPTDYLIPGQDLHSSRPKACRFARRRCCCAHDDHVLAGRR